MVILKLKNTNYINYIIKLNYIYKIIVSSEVSFGKKGYKHFIGYKDGK